MCQASAPEVPLTSPVALRVRVSVTRRRAAALRDTSDKLQATASAERDRANRNVCQIAEAITRWVGQSVFDPPPGGASEN